MQVKSGRVLPSLILRDEGIQLFLLRGQGAALLPQSVRLSDEVPCFRFGRIERRPHLGTVVLHRRNRGLHRLDSIDHLRKFTEETLVDLPRKITCSLSIHASLKKRRSNQQIDNVVCADL